jgi:DNA-binding transcriptional ArsR family regulator
VQKIVVGRREKGAGDRELGKRQTQRPSMAATLARCYTLVQLYSCDILLVMATTPAVPHPLPELLVELIAQRFKVLAEPMRVRLLDRLRDGEATVQELTEALGASQQNVSKHLGVLLQAGMVSRTKQGTSALYAIADPDVFALCELVCGGIRRQVGELDALLQGDR